MLSFKKQCPQAFLISLTRGGDNPPTCCLMQHSFLSPAEFECIMPLDSFLPLTSLFLTRFPSCHLMPSFPLSSKWQCPPAQASGGWCGQWRGQTSASGGQRSAQGCGKSSSVRTKTGRWDSGCGPSTTWVTIASSWTSTCSHVNYSAQTDCH